MVPWKPLKQCYVPVNSKTAHAPPTPAQADPRAFDFWKILVKFPGMLAVEMVKCPTG